MDVCPGGKGYRIRTAYLVYVNAMAEGPGGLEVVLDALLQLFGHL